ncbi:MAG: threonine/serine exporter family protein [Actinomycetia bacterium]|nr:threonine/serine exporter family protein [Actinomycetes bacterium]
MTDPTPPRWRTALWRGETAPIPVVRTPTRAVYPRRGPGDDAELAAVDQGASLALRVGTLLLSGGAPTEEVEAAVFAVGSAVGLGVFEVDITYGSIIISIAPTNDRPGLADMRVVRGRSTHFARVAAAHQLVLDLSEGRLPPDEVDGRLSTIEHLRRPYPRWFVIVAFGVLASAITVQLGALSTDSATPLRAKDFITPSVAFLAAMATGLVGSRMARRRVPTFFVNLALALGVAMIAVGIRGLESRFEELPFQASLVIIGGIIALLPGMSLMVAAQEAIGSFTVTAAARIVELTFATVGIVAGVLLALNVAGALDITMAVTVRPDASPATITTAVIAGTVAAAAAAITYQSPAQLAAVGGALAGLGIFVYGTVSTIDSFSGSPGATTAAAAIVIGFTSRLLGARLRVPPVLLTAAGIIPLLPGLAVYSGLLGISSDSPDKGIASLVGAATIAIALAAGVLLGQLVAGRLLRRPSLVPPRDVRRRLR